MHGYGSGNMARACHGVLLHDCSSPGLLPPQGEVATAGHDADRLSESEASAGGLYADDEVMQLGERMEDSERRTAVGCARMFEVDGGAER